MKWSCKKPPFRQKLCLDTKPDNPPPFFPSIKAEILTAVQKLVDNNQTDKIKNYQQARIFVTLMFQRIIRDDYLEIVLEHGVYKYYFANPQNQLFFGDSFHLQNFEGVVPYEFSHAVGRFGHSMIKGNYAFALRGKNIVDLLDIFQKGRMRDYGKRIDWRAFFDMGFANDRINRAAKIGLSFEDGLNRIPSWAKIIKLMMLRAWEAFSNFFLTISILTLRLFGYVPARTGFSKNSVTSSAWWISSVWFFYRRMRLRNATRSLLKLDVLASSKVPTGFEVVSWLNDSEGAKDLRAALGEGLFEGPKDLKLKGSTLDPIHKIKVGVDPNDIQSSEVLEINRLPLWLYILRESEEYPKNSAGSLPNKLGPVASVVFSETLRVAIDYAEVSIHKDLANYEESLGKLYQIESSLLTTELGKLKMKDIYNYIK